MKKYDVMYVRDGKVAFVDTFDTFREADYFANVECEGEWYEPDGKGYTLTVVPHTEVVNCTPHDVVIVGAGLAGADLVLKPSGILPRVSSRTETVGFIGNIRITRNTYGEVYGLPEECEGTIYIVSLAVAKAAKNRHDLFIPNESVRNEKGVIIGCNSLALN